MILNRIQQTGEKWFEQDEQLEKHLRISSAHHAMKIGIGREKTWSQNHRVTRSKRTSKAISIKC